MQNNYSILLPSSNALPFNGDCDKPFGLGFNFMYKQIDELYQKLLLETDKSKRKIIIDKVHSILESSPHSAINNRSIINMYNEVWLPIIDYEGRYEISNYGRVKSLMYARTKNPKILK